MEDYQVLQLKSEDIDKVWVGVEPLIQDALDSMSIGGQNIFNYLNTGDYYEWARKDLLQIFIVVEDKQIKLITLTQLLPHPRFKVLEYLMTSGKGLKKFSERLVQTIEDFAIAEGCKRLMVTAPKGVVGYLKDWEELKDRHKITLMKEL
tara:strand:- start:333 stop:779 length:447 start_codon:yes stop_codon:yes gene_type:complete